MIEVKKEGVLLAGTDLAFENDGVLNPAAVRQGDSVHLFYRAVQKGNFSTIGYCRLDGPLTVAERREEPFISPEFDYESHGVEDPRVVKVEDRYYLTYTAYDGTNARAALAISKDLKHFEKQGIIVPHITYEKFVQLAESTDHIHKDYFRNHKFYYPKADIDKKKMLWDKNVLFFPRRINGKLVFLHRIRPGIQLVAVKNLDELTGEFWENYFRQFQKHIVLDPFHTHESSYIGGGCPPIETDAGWLMIYHGVEKTKAGLVYSACAALLDLDDPTKELARLPYALFSPEQEWELEGVVNNVVFPTGTAVYGETLFIYYGAADSRIACASVNLSDLTAELVTYVKNKEQPHVSTYKK